MKIAFIRYRYTPYGGAERFTDIVAKSLVKSGIEVHLFAREWTGVADEGVRLHRIGGPTWPRLLAHAGFAWLVKRAVQSEPFDLIQSNERTLCQHVYRAGDGVHARWLELRGSQQSWWRQFAVCTNPFHHYRLWMERRLFESPDLRAVIVNSEMVRREILERFAISNHTIRTIYNGVDLEHFHPSNRATLGQSWRDRCGLDDSSTLVLWVGSGFERKGLSFVLKSMAMTGGKAKLWVVGKGKVGPYERLARRLGLEHQVTFWGPQRDVAPFYAAADIFVLPTLYDPFPTVVLEALASGLPVITTAQCGAAEIITEGGEGFVVPFADRVEDIARGLRHLYEPDRRRWMSIKARALAEAFPMERTVRETEQLYRELLKPGT